MRNPISRVEIALTDFNLIKNFLITQNMDINHIYYYSNELLKIIPPFDYNKFRMFVPL